MTALNIANLRREYKSRSLDWDNLLKDPIKQFSVWFEEAHKAGEYEPNAMALATADKSGQPSVRMVLLKGLEQEGFTFYTNYASQKGQELVSNPKGSLLFWWQTIERQVRINGTVQKVASNISDEYFDSRPIGSRLGAIASPQSQPINGRDVLEKNYEKAAEQLSNEGKIVRPDHWGGFVLIPEIFEFWQGRENRMHDRFKYTLSSGHWAIDRLAP